MRQEAWDELKLVLHDYPFYDHYLREMRYSKLYPYRRPDENIGGGKASMSPDGIERTVVTIADDMVMNKMQFQQRVVEETLDKSPEWVGELIEMMYFHKERKSMTEASQLVGRNWRTCKKAYVEFMERLAGNLGIYKGD